MKGLLQVVMVNNRGVFPIAFFATEHGAILTGAVLAAKDLVTLSTIQASAFHPEKVLGCSIGPDNTHIRILNGDQI